MLASILVSIALITILLLSDEITKPRKIKESRELAIAVSKGQKIDTKEALKARKMLEKANEELYDLYARDKLDRTGMEEMRFNTQCISMLRPLAELEEWAQDQKRKKR